MTTIFSKIRKSIVSDSETIYTITKISGSGEYDKTKMKYEIKVKNCEISYLKLRSYLMLMVKYWGDIFNNPNWENLQCEITIKPDFLTSKNDEDYFKYGSLNRLEITYFDHKVKLWENYQITIESPDFKRKFRI